MVVAVTRILAIFVDRQPSRHDRENIIREQNPKQAREITEVGRTLSSLDDYIIVILVLDYCIAIRVMVPVPTQII